MASAQRGITSVHEFQLEDDDNFVILEDLAEIPEDDDKVPSLAQLCEDLLNDDDGDAYADVENLPRLPLKHPEEWDTAAVCNYLRRRDLPAKLRVPFQNPDSLVNGLMCRELDDQDLRHMGIDNAFHRRRLLREFDHLFDNWPASCEGWLDDMKPSSRPGSAGRLRWRKQPVWPPPPPKVRPKSAPSRGQCSSFTLWQKQKEEEKNLLEERLVEVHRAGGGKREGIHALENSDLFALRDLFKTTKSDTQSRGSALFKRLSLDENPKKGTSDQPGKEVRKSNVKKQMMEVRRRAQVDLSLGMTLDFGSKLSNQEPAPPTFSKQTSTPRQKRLNRQLTRQRTGNMQPRQSTAAKKRESTMECMNRMSRVILADSEDEAEMRLAFLRYAYRGFIHRSKLWHVLADLGLIAKTKSSKQLVNHWFEKRYADFLEKEDYPTELSSQGKAPPSHSASVNFEFAVVHVSDVRAALNNELRKDLWDHFQKADDDGNAVLDLDEVLSALAAFELCPQNEAELNDLLLAINDIDRDGNGIDFEEFVELATRVRLHLNADRRNQQREIATEAGLSDEMFYALRNDIIKLRRGFETYDVDGSGTLEGSEVSRLLLDTGLAPQTSAQRYAFSSRLEQFVDYTGHISLDSYFNLCYFQRRIFEEEWRERTYSLFRQCDKDNSNTLESSEVGHVLVKLGLQPRSKAEQKHIAEIVEEADVDGSGSIDLHEFETIVHRVAARLRAVQRERHEEFALALGFPKARFLDLQKLHDELEDLYDIGDGSGFDVLGLRHVVNKRRMPFTSTALRFLFEQLDEDKLGRLGIFQFLQFMWIIENNAFDSHTGTITQPPPVKPSRQDLQGQRIRPQYYSSKSATGGIAGIAQIGQFRRGSVSIGSFTTV